MRRNRNEEYEADRHGVERLRRANRPNGQGIMINMIVHGFACDDDGTIAEEGRVADATARVLERVREAGRKIMLGQGQPRRQEHGAGAFYSQARVRPSAGRPTQRTG
jgi:hypothetical protein